MTPDLAMQRADQNHRAGNAAEAEKICRQILAQHADYPGALHLLGILEAQAGNLDAALGLIGRAVHLKPDFVQAWFNLGCVLVNFHKFEEAISVYNRLTELRPQDANPHYAVAILLHELGRSDEAIAAFHKATQLRPDFADAHMRLGQALRDHKRLDDAIAAFSKAIALRPDWADAHNNLANVLRDKGLLDQAITQYTKAAELKADDAVIQFNLGNIYYQKERLADALQAYERAVQLKSDYYEAHSLKGLVLAGLERYEEAAQAHRQALDLRPDNATAHEALGSALLHRLDAVGAEASFRKSLALAPDSPSVCNGLGMALRSLGRFEEAADCFRRALAMSPDKASILRNLISIGAQTSDPAAIEQLAALLNQSGLHWRERMEAAFALGKLLDDADRFDEAFACFAQANDLMKQTPAAGDEIFDADYLHLLVHQMVESSHPQFFAERRQWGEPSELPVFIVGMPRSGTTLVEQIAASHPAVFGAGELTDIGRIASELTSGKTRAGHRWDAESIATASRAHLQRLRMLGGAAARVTDKMPGNAFHLGLIAVLFPAARIIFCRRDARDTCLSCYFQRFDNSRLGYTYDLADCGRQWLETDRLMNHWIQVLPLKMMEMHYEEIVADQEGQSRRLIDFLGLPWDPACLEFHRTQRTVMTASVWQVRQPIYSRSVGRWRHYERHLGPLLDVLAGRPVVQTDSTSTSWEKEGFLNKVFLEINPLTAKTRFAGLGTNRAE
jgi:tetratricopeptide (TPR) repeat protein